MVGLTFPLFFFATVDTIFELVSEYQQLYPDPELSGESGEEEEEEEEITEDTEYFTTAEGLEHLSIEGQATLSHLDGILRVQENGHGKIKLLYNYY